MTVRRSFLLAIVLLGAAPVAPPAETLRVLVTNDDGVGAPGIDALVSQLGLNPELELTVIAPATNQSGTGDQRTTASFTVTSSSTAGGFAATALAGFPADTVLFGVLQALPSPPDLVVSGVNNGQNIGEAVGISGTIGAAFWAARLGIPAFAVSAGSGLQPNFSDAARFTAQLVEHFRMRMDFQRKMKEREPPFHGLVLNINFPTCTTGTVRGVRVVSVGRSSTITGYTLLSDIGGVQTWQPVLQNVNLFASDCTSALGPPLTDVEGMTNGFATVSPLDADRSVSGRRLRDFKFVEKLF